MLQLWSGLFTSSKHHISKNSSDRPLLVESVSDRCILQESKHRQLWKYERSNAIYPEHVDSYKLWWRCKSGLKRWKSPPASNALLWNNQLKWLCVWQFSNCGHTGWVEIHMTFHHIYTLYTIGQRQNECTKVFGKYKFIIQDLWTHLCNMKQLASFPGYPLTPTKIKNGTSFPGPLSLFLRRAWEQDYSQNGFVTLHNP